MKNRLLAQSQEKKFGLLKRESKNQPLAGSRHDRGRNKSDKSQARQNL